MSPDIAWTGSEFVTVWSDGRSGHYENYLARITAGGTILANARVQATPRPAEYPAVVWTGSELGITWQDSRNPALDIYFRRLDPTGAPIATEMRITHAEGMSVHPAIAWSSHAHAIVWPDDRIDNLEIHSTTITCDGLP
jgi:hypothetical protein